MALTYSEAKDLLSEVETDYQGRHEDHARLRSFWHGRYWDEAETMTRGLANLWRDAVNSKGDMGPDFKLVRNLIYDVCVKYQTYLSNLPMIHVPNERPDSRRAKAQASLKERAIYGSWAEAGMVNALNQGAWYGPLMGDWVLGIMPNFDKKCVYAIVRSPEFAYPLPGADGSASKTILFRWETTAAAAKRDYPNWDGKARAGSKSVEILEFSDGDCFQRWVNGQQVNGVEHGLGFNLFDQVPFIQVPGEVWNHSAVEQAVGLTQAGSMLWSLEMQAAIENVFPRLVLEDPMKFSEDIDTGPGAVIAVNPGGKAYYLQTPGVGGGVPMLQENERAIKQDTSMPDVNFGQFDASIITGKAINALQGAGTGSLVEMVQGASHGPALTSWNEKALTIYQRMWSEDQIYLQGVKPSSMVDLNPRQFAISFKGKEIVGSARNDVVFGPYMDAHGKLVMALQAQGAGLVSKAYSREQIGIPDSDEMQAEIMEEVIEEAVIGAVIQALQADPSAESGDQASAQMGAYLDGGPVRAPLNPAPPPGSPPVLGGPPAGGPPGGPGLPPPGVQPGGGQLSSPPLQLPPGSPQPQAGAPPEAAPQTPAAPASAGVTIQQAQAAFQNVQLAGRAWLVGEIAATGSSDTADVAVTDPADRQPLGDAADFPVRFTVVTGEPKEQAVEIGTG